MSRKEEMPVGPAFEDSLLKALKLYGQPEKLGTESPLATTYFLNRTLLHEEYLATPTARGQLLKSAIKKAAEQLWQGDLPKNREEMQAALVEVRKERGSTRYSYLLLELRYFQEYLQPRTLREIYESDDYLIDSKTGDHRSHKLALQHLGETFLTQLRPALRLEQPIVPELFIGYEQEQQKLSHVLQEKQTISLNGAGGTGKTSLAAHTLHNIQDRAIFWYTFHPTLNDRLSSLLFSLGHFLHEQSASQLWQYLLSNQGELTDFTIALGLVRQDIASLQENPPLLCFDELDRVYHSDPGQIEPPHLQILEFIESLRGMISILLIGQRPTVDSDTYVTLSGFKGRQIALLWQAGGQPVSHTDADKLHDATLGNLRLLRICLTLHQDGEALDEIIAQLSSRTGMYPIFHRLWLRLDENERQLMQQLAVFRGPAPVLSWDEQTVTSLTTRHLVEKDDQGSISTVGGLQDLIYHELSTEQREHLHLQAAHTLFPYAEYTEVAYHFWKAGQSNQAIQLWYPHRQSEIQRGYTDAALAIFEGISRNQVSAKEQRGLDLIRAELRLMRGDLSKGLADITANITKPIWQDPSEARARLLAIQGYYQDALGYPDQAIRTYEEGIQLLTRLQTNTSRLHHQLSRLHLRQRELPEAKREARLLECQLQNLFGRIEDEEGCYQDALISYQKAFVLAQNLDDEASIAESSRNLANLLGGRLQKLDEAIGYAQKAMAYYAQMGDRLRLEYVRSNLVYVYIQNRQFQAALETASKTYRFFKTINNPYEAAVQAVNLAEVHFELENLAEAEKYAREALELEERQTYPYALYNLGRIEQQRGNSASAESHFNQSMSTAVMNDDLYIKTYAMRELGKTHLHMNDKNTAQKILLATVQSFQQLGMPNEVRETEIILNAFV